MAFVVEQGVGGFWAGDGKFQVDATGGDIRVEIKVGCGFPRSEMTQQGLQSSVFHTSALKFCGKPFPEGLRIWVESRFLWHQASVTCWAAFA